MKIVKKIRLILPLVVLISVIQLIKPVSVSGQSNPVEDLTITQNKQANTNFNTLVDSLELRDLAEADGSGSQIEEANQVAEFDVEPHVQELSEEQTYYSYLYEGDNPAEIYLFFQNDQLIYMGLTDLSTEPTTGQPVGEGDGIADFKGTQVAINGVGLTMYEQDYVGVVSNVIEEDNGSTQTHIVEDGTVVSTKTAPFYLSLIDRHKTYLNDLLNHLGTDSVAVTPISNQTADSGQSSDESESASQADETSGDETIDYDDFEMEDKESILAEVSPEQRMSFPEVTEFFESIVSDLNSEEPLTQNAVVDSIGSPSEVYEGENYTNYIYVGGNDQEETLILTLQFTEDNLSQITTQSNTLELYEAFDEGVREELDQLEHAASNFADFTDVLGEPTMRQYNVDSGQTIYAWQRLNDEEISHVIVYNVDGQTFEVEQVMLNDTNDESEQSNESNNN